MTTNDRDESPRHENPAEPPRPEGPPAPPTPQSGQAPPAGQAPPWAGHGGPVPPPGATAAPGGFAPGTAPPPLGQQPPSSSQQHPPFGQQTPYGQQPPFTAPVPPRQESTAGFFDSLRRTGIWRSEDRWIGGVASGVARRLDVDPLLIRGVLVVLTIFGGLGLLLYGLGWALLPEEGDGRIHTQEALRGNVDAALAGAIAFVVVGLARPVGWWDMWWFWDGFGITVVALAVSAVILAVALSRRNSQSRGHGPGGPGTGPGGQPHPGTQHAAAPATPPTDGPVPPPPPGTAPGAGSGAPGDPGATGSGSWGPAPAYAGAAPARSASLPPAGVPWSPTPARAPRRPPTPPRPRTPGPGKTLVAVTLGLVLLAAAAVLIWDRTDDVWHAPLVIGGAAALLLGLGVMVAAVRGRRGGALSWLGILVALVVVPATVAISVEPVFGQVGWRSTVVGDHEFRPTTADSARRGFTQMAGALDVDLSGLDLSDVDGQVNVPVNLGTGDLTVTLPKDAAVEARIHVGAGGIATQLDGSWETGDMAASDGAGIEQYWISPEAGDGGADLVVHVTLGAGDVMIREQS